MAYVFRPPPHPRPLLVAVAALFAGAPPAEEPPLRPLPAQERYWAGVRPAFPHAAVEAPAHVVVFMLPGLEIPPPPRPDTWWKTFRPYAYPSQNDAARDLPALLFTPAADETPFPRLGDRALFRPAPFQAPQGSRTPLEIIAANPPGDPPLTVSGAHTAWWATFRPGPGPQQRAALAVRLFLDDPFLVLLQPPQGRPYLHPTQARAFQPALFGDTPVLPDALYRRMAGQEEWWVGQRDRRLPFIPQVALAPLIPPPVVEDPPLLRLLAQDRWWDAFRIPFPMVPRSFLLHPSAYPPPIIDDPPIVYHPAQGLYWQTYRAPYIHPQLLPLLPTVELAPGQLDPCSCAALQARLTLIENFLARLRRPRDRDAEDLEEELRKLRARVLELETKTRRGIR